MTPCAGTTTKGQPCKRAAVEGFRFCSSHGFTKKYFIKIQQRRSPKPGEDRRDWRSWRKFAVWPILFTSRQAAEAHMDLVYVFKNLTGRKMSASVECTKRVFPVEGASLEVGAQS